MSYSSPNVNRNTTLSVPRLQFTNRGIIHKYMTGLDKIASSPVTEQRLRSTGASHELILTANATTRASLVCQHTTGGRHAAVHARTRPPLLRAPRHVSQSDRQSCRQAVWDEPAGVSLPTFAPLSSGGSRLSCTTGAEPATSKPKRSHQIEKPRKHGLKKGYTQIHAGPFI